MVIYKAVVKKSTFTNSHAHRFTCALNYIYEGNPSDSHVTTNISTIKHIHQTTRCRRYLCIVTANVDFPIYPLEVAIDTLTGMLHNLFHYQGFPSDFVTFLQGSLTISNKRFILLFILCLQENAGILVQVILFLPTVKLASLALKQEDIKHVIFLVFKFKMA